MSEENPDQPTGGSEESGVSRRAFLLASVAAGAGAASIGSGQTTNAVSKTTIGGGNMSDQLSHAAARLYRVDESELPSPGVEDRVVEITNGGNNYDTGDILIDTGSSWVEWEPGVGSLDVTNQVDAGSVSTEKAVIEHTEDVRDDANGPIEIIDADNPNSEKLIIGNEGGSHSNEDMIARINRQINGGIKAYRNLIYDENDGQWELEKDGRGSMLEIGAEGVQGHVIESGTAGDGGLTKLFNASTHNGNFVVNPEGLDTVRFVFGNDEVAENGTNIDAGTQILGDNSQQASQTLARYGSSSFGPYQQFAKSRSGTVGSPGGAVQDGDSLALTRWYGDDGNAQYQEAARLSAEVSGGVSAGAVPGRIVFSTANGTGTLNNNWAIEETGHLNFLNSSHYSETADDMTANPENDTEDGYWTIELGGTRYQIPVYEE